MHFADFWFQKILDIIQNDQQRWNFDNLVSEMALGWDFLGIPNLGIGDGDFSFWARSKNPRGFEISGMGIGDLESPKIPSEKSPKNPQSREWGIGIFEARKSPKFYPWDFLGMGIFFSWDGISHQKATTWLSISNRDPRYYASKTFGYSTDNLIIGQNKIAQHPDVYEN